MNVSIATIQRSLIIGINYSIAFERTTAGHGSTFVGENVNKGLDHLRQLGLGSAVTELEGYIRVLAVDENLLPEPAPSLDLANYWADHGQSIASLLRAFLKVTPLFEAQMIMSGLSIFDDNAKVHALLAGLAEIDLQIKQDVRSFVSDLVDATEILPKYTGKIRVGDGKGNQKDRAATMLQWMIECSRISSVARVSSVAGGLDKIGLDDLIDELHNLYPKELSQAQMDKFYQVRTEYYQSIMRVILSAFDKKMVQKLSQDDVQCLCRTLSKQLDVFGSWWEKGETDDTRVYTRNRARASYCQAKLYSIKGGEPRSNTHNRAELYAIGGGESRKTYERRECFEILYVLELLAESEANHKMRWGWNPLRWGRNPQDVSGQYRERSWQYKGRL